MYQHKIQFALILTIFLSVSCASTGEAIDETKKPNVDPKEALSKAEKLYKERKDLDKVREAIKTLESARDMDNRNFDVEWNFARMSYFLGSRKSVDESEAEKVLKKGLSAAKIAKRMQPNKPDGHFWYAAILGEQSKRSPVTVGITSIKEIRKSMKKVIEIDENYQGASAYDGLGQLEMGTRGLAGGSIEKAVEYLEKALELNKENSYIRLHLGEAYLASNRDAEAKKQLEYILKMKPDPDYIPEYEESVEAAKKLLKEKF